MTNLRTIDEQRELVDSFTRPALAMFPLSRLREGSSPDIGSWAQIAELGWLGISLADECGGIGLGPIEEALAAQTLGRQLLTPAFLATVIAARLAALSGQPALAQDLASGVQRAALGLSHARDGANGVEVQAGDLLLTIGPDHIALSPAAEAREQDAVHWSLPLHEAAVGEPLAVSNDPALFAFAQLVAAATLSGIATQSCELGVEYAKVREQFGQPIGAFQAVKHHCANMAINAYGAREIVVQAAMALEDGQDDAGTLAAAALNFSLRAARTNAGLSIQVHGGIGFSAECDAHQFLKRAHLIEAAFGGIGAIRQRLCDRQA